MRRCIKLGSIIQQIRGVSYKPTDVKAVGDPNAIALLRANNIQDEGLNFDDLVYVDKSKVSTEQMIRKGDIVLCSSSGSKNLVGKAAIAERDLPYAFGAFCKVIRTTTMDAAFVGQYFKSPRYRREISAVSVGANINNIRNEYIDEMLLPVYSDDEQHEIAQKLLHIETLISNRHMQLVLIAQLVKSRFIELFGDFDLSHPQDSWFTIKEIGTVVGGATPKTDVDEYWGGTYRWITPAELKADSGYIFDSVRKLTKAGIDSCSLQEFPIGTVILTSRAPIGKVAIAGNTFYCNQGFKNIICKETVIPRYLYTVLLLNVDYLNSLGRGATFKEISKGIVENIRIPVPPMALQNQFAAFVEQVDKSKYYSSLSYGYCQMAAKILRQEWLTCPTSDF